MKFNKLPFFALLSTLSLIVGCGESTPVSTPEKSAEVVEKSTSPQESSTIESAKKAPSLSRSVNGYKKDSTLARHFQEKNSQALADILFMYLLKDRSVYRTSIAYESYQALNLGSLTKEEFDKQFVLDYMSYKDEANNLVAQMVEALKDSKIEVATASNRSLRAIPSDAPVMSEELLRGKTYYVFTEARNIMLTINDAITKASAKAGFFNIDVNLELSRNSIFTSSSQGDLHMWLRYPPRENEAGDLCLCLDSEDVNGVAADVSYYFTNEADQKAVSNNEEAESLCKNSFQELQTSSDTQMCVQVLTYLENPVTGVCTEFKNSCDAVNSGWSNSCTIAEEDDLEESLIVVGEVSATTINESLLEAYRVALESDVISIELIDLAIEYDAFRELLLESLNSGSFNTIIVPQLSQNSHLGEKFLELMKSSKSVSDFVFENLDEKSYIALMKSLMLSKKASLLFSQVLKSNPNYLAEGSSLHKLIFSVNATHGDGSDNANEMLFTAMFSSSAAVKNTLDAVESLDGNVSDKYLDFIFLGKLEGIDANETITQQYYNLSAVAEGMVVGMKAETGEGLTSFSYTTKLVGYFLTSISPSKYLAYGRALYSAGTDYLAKVDPSNLALFKGALTNPIVQLESNTSLAEGNSSNSADELHGVQYSSETEAVQAVIDTNISNEQVTQLSDYETTKKATSSEESSGYFTLFPTLLSSGSEVVPTAEENVMNIDVVNSEESSIFFLAPEGTTPDVGVDIEPVEGVNVESTTGVYDIFKLSAMTLFKRSTNSATSIFVDKTKDIHLIVVPK